MDACPYLRPAPNHGACCTARLPAEAPGSAYRAAVCLTLRHRQCPRLPEARAAWGAAVGPPPARRPAPSRQVDVAARAQAQRTGGHRLRTLAVTLSLGLASCVLLALLLIIAIVYRPQIGRALESTSLLTRSTQAVASPSDPAPTVGATAQPRALDTTAPSPTLPATSTPLPAWTGESSAAFIPTTASTATLEPSPTPVPATVTPLPTPTPIPLPTGAPPTRLVIPSIQLDTPVRPVGPVTVVRGGEKMVIWDTLHDIASFHETSAYPGTGGNVVINGHRDIYGSVFLHLDKVRRGDQILVYVGELTYIYEVVDILKLPYVNASPAQMAEQLRLIGPADEERLTILTCTPVGKATHRLYVLAEPPSSERDDLSVR